MRMSLGQTGHSFAAGLGTALESRYQSLLFGYEQGSGDRHNAKIEGSAYT